MLGEHPRRHGWDRGCFISQMKWGAEAESMVIPGSLFIHPLICKVFPHLTPCSDWLRSLLYATFPKSEAIWAFPQGWSTQSPSPCGTEIQLGVSLLAQHIAHQQLKATASFSIQPLQLLPFISDCFCPMHSLFLQEKEGERKPLEIIWKQKTAPATRC